MAMPSKTFNEYGRDRAGLMNELPGRQSREQIMLAAHAADLDAGTVLAKVLEGTLTATAGAVVAGAGGTPGNGTVTALTPDANAGVGVYQVRFLNPAANAGYFEVLNPDGGVDGNGQVGVAYNGVINFTITDGTNDFQEDDRIPITVSAATGSGQYVPLDPNAANGSEEAVAILLDGRLASPSAAQRAVIIARGAEWAANFLQWPAGISGPQQATAEAQLADKGILVRHPA